MEQIQLFTKLNYLPDDLKSEVNDFIDFLLSKRKKGMEKRTPKFGSAKGQIFISPDFDKPLDDFKDYMQ
ncbi:type II toxin-antitoxin system VapB family antitoxin [Mariniphaga sediminis]|uniref:type II toxin-antitoxin system VapB family antitoxin n=1 Tax=Mariniphaga sediminis TaxID=1628158 RepID=UPI00356AB1EB